LETLVTLQAVLRSLLLSVSKHSKPNAGAMDPSIEFVCFKALKSPFAVLRCLEVGVSKHRRSTASKHSVWVMHTMTSWC